VASPDRRVRILITRSAALLHSVVNHDPLIDVDEIASLLRELIST